jgi:dethiobiotin synthetase
MGIVTCISGIDTDIGKTIATGLMAKSLLQSGYSVITQKIVQTGCSGIAEDIIAHRELMGIALQPEDKRGITCPYVFQKACSPHLAAELENKFIDTKKISEATEKLLARFDHVLLEGVGGLQVPLTREITLLDYIQEQDYPLILVSSSKLGSINHTLSALELAKNRGIRVNGIVYNSFDTSDTVIAEDSRNVFLTALQKYGFQTRLITLEPKMNYSRDGMKFPCLQLFDL